MRILTSLLLSVPTFLALGAEPAAIPAPQPAPAPAAQAEAGKASSSGISPELAAALARLKLPGVKINLAERCVDVEASVCLREGLLELVACTKGTKEHESLVVVEAKPSHIHTALLLLRAVPGNPAMHQPLNPEGTRFMPVPPRGGAVDVFLVLKNRDGKLTESPITDFIERADEHREPGNGDEGGSANESAKFPTHTFLFAGSVIVGEGESPRQYLCDQSGNLISIATFGDELLCLPGVHAADNGALVWAAKPDRLPEIGTKITLRLRPQVKGEPAPKTEAKPATK